MHRNPSPCHQFTCNSPITRNLHSFGKLLALALVLAACLTRPAAAQTTYTITDLGTLGGASSVGYGINASGQVTGSSITADGLQHAFMISPPYSSMTDLGTLSPGLPSAGYDINDSGQVTGFAGSQAFVTSPPYSSLTYLPGPSVAHGINASGQVAGSFFIDPIENFSYAFVTSPPYSSLTHLGSLDDVYGSGNGINDSGQVTGYSHNGGQAFVTSLPYSSFTVLGTLAPGGAGASFGGGINASGQVTGFSHWYDSNCACFIEHAFVTSPPYSSMTDLGTLGGRISWGLATNASGQVTGVSTTASGDYRGFLWTSAGGMVDLNTLLPGGSGWTLHNAHAINDSGQITGYGINPSGREHAYLLTPATYALSVSPSTVTGGQSSTATVTLAGAAPAGGAVVAVSSNSGSAQVPASGTVTVPGGSTSASFPVTTSSLSSITQATISAVYSGVTKTALLTINPAGAATYGLSVSTQSNRNGGVALQGATVGGSVYVFTSPASQPANFNPTGISGVCFWLDNPSMSGPANHCEAAVPYDYAGSASTTIANPWNTTAVANGTHTITQLVTLSAGGTQTSTATFTISNAGAPPPINCSIYVDKRSCNANAACVWKPKTGSCVNR